MPRKRSAHIVEPPAVVHQCNVGTLRIVNMLKIKTVTAKNFLSIGNTTQAVDFNRCDLTLVLGENLDLGGDDAGARNGTGKCCCINTLVRVRNTKTGEITELTMGELYNAALEQQSRKQL